MPGSNELEEVRTREELVEFLGVLLERLRTGSDEAFANRTLEQFLEAAAAAVDSLPGLYANHGLVLAEQPTWGVLGLIFEAASLLD